MHHTINALLKLDHLGAFDPDVINHALLHVSNILRLFS